MTLIFCLPQDHWSSHSEIFIGILVPDKKRTLLTLLLSYFSFRVGTKQEDDEKKKTFITFKVKTLLNRVRGHRAQSQPGSVR